MTPRPFDLEAARARLGPEAVEAARRVAATAPPLTPEQRAQIRAVFTTARPRQAQAA